MTRSFRYLLSLTFIFSFLLIPLLPVLFSEEEEVDDPGEFRAILIGIDEYKHWPGDKEYAKLNYCVKDIEAIAEILKKNGYKDKNITIVKEETAGRESFPAKKSRIEDKITEVIAGCKENDVLLIYFAGHGIHLDDGNYLVPYDGEYISGDQTAEERTRRKETLLKVSGIDDLIRNNCHAGTKYFIMDACQKDVLANVARGEAKVKSDFHFTPADVKKGLIKITSCRAGESSLEDRQKGHGLFSYALIEGVEDKADTDQDGRVTITELFKYISNRVPEYAREKAGNQTPLLLMEEVEGEIIFAYNPQKIKANTLKRSSEKLLEEARQESSEEDKKSKLTTALEKLTEAQKIWPGGEYDYLAREIQDELAGLTGVKVKKLTEEAMKLYESGDYEESLKKIEEAITLDPEDARNKGLKDFIVKALEAQKPDPAKKAQKLTEEAWRLYESGDYEGALAKINEALEQDTENISNKAIKKLIVTASKKAEERTHKTAAPVAAPAPAPEPEPIAAPVSAVANSVRDFEYTTSDGEVTITKLKNTKCKIVNIPRTIDGLPVTSIGRGAFYECIRLTSVTIPESVTSIGEGAFYDCSSLMSVTIPEDVTSIGDCAFDGCSSLTSVTIPESVKSIGIGAFAGCSGLTSIEVASGNTHYQCIDGVLFTKDGKTIHSYPGGKKGLYRIPVSVTSIEDCAFYDCSSLTSMTIPESVTSIGDGAFAGCIGLTSIEVASGNTVYQCIDGALFTKDGKTIHSYPAGKKGSYRVSASVTSVAERAFNSCNGLTSVTIPESVTSIGEYAFFKSNSLTSVTILANVTSIGEAAFAECSGLTSLTIPASVTSIGPGAFAGCSGLTSLTIPASVTSIGPGAFAECKGLTSLTIPASVTSIGPEAFAECKGLTSLTIPANVTSIGRGVFYRCSGLTSVTIPASVTSIGDGAFYGCSGLTSVTIPASVTSIGEGAFWRCDNLTIRTPAGSAAEKYAEAKGIKIQIIASMTQASSPLSSVQLAEYRNSLGQTFNLIPSGEFMMGDTLTPEEVDKKYPGGKVEWYKDAHPRHKVVISKPFYMGIHEVTVGDFRKFVDATGYKTTAEKEGTARGFNGETGKWEDIKGLTWQNPTYEQESSHPVLCVSWNDAMEYIKWLNRTDTARPTGYTYRLPSEAEWEYACRAGSNTDFFWGDDPKEGEGYINGAGEEGAPNGKKWSLFFPFNDGYTWTSPVGSFKPNKFGLYDMLGNVWEWCGDWYGADYYTNSPSTDPTGPDSGSDRVNRGGSWNFCARNCRSALRFGDDPERRDFSLGFRLALSSTH